MNDQAQHSLDSFTRRQENVLNSRNTEIDGLKRLYDSEIEIVANLIKKLCNAVNEGGFGQASYHQPIASYDLVGKTVSVQFPVTINAAVLTVNYTSDNEKTTVNGRTFIVGGKELPYDYISELFSDWLKQDTIVRLIQI